MNNDMTLRQYTDMIARLINETSDHVEYTDDLPAEVIIKMIDIGGEL